MSIWGAILLSQSDALECASDASCNKFYSIAKANMIAGFCYSFWLLFLKQIVVCIGLQYWGFREMERDEKALKDRKIKELGDSNISGMHSTLYNRLKPARAPSLYLDDLENDEGARSRSSHRQVCPVCNKVYGERDRVTVLQCAKSHMAHTSCIQESIISQMRCPICASRSRSLSRPHSA